MHKKFDDPSMQEALRMAQSDAGKALLAHLQANHGTKLNQATAQLEAGNMEEVKKTMDALLSSPEVRAMIEKLKG